MPRRVLFNESNGYTVRIWLSAMNIRKIKKISSLGNTRSKLGDIFSSSIASEGQYLKKIKVQLCSSIALKNDVKEGQYSKRKILEGQYSK